MRRTVLRLVLALALVVGVGASGVGGPTATAATPPVEGGFVPLSPSRILDTRNGTGGVSGAVASGADIDVQVTAVGGVPGGAVSAVVLNATVTQPSADGFLTIWPSGEPMPLASNLNFVAGQTVPNLVVVKVGANGKVRAHVSAGAAHVLFDIAGYYTTAGTAAQQVPVSPARILDTRAGTGGISGAIAATAEVDVQVTGVGGIPASAVTAVVLNATVTEPTDDGHLTIWPAGETMPLASNLNFVAGQTVPNLVVVKVGANGKVRVHPSAGSAHVVFDVAGYFSSTAAPGAFTPLSPTRLLDTRSTAAVGPGKSVSIYLPGQAGIPASGVSAVVLNITVTAPTAAGYLTAHPGGESVPLASNVNFVVGQTVPNLAFVKVGANGVVSIYNSAGSSQIVVDVAGWVGTPPEPPPPPDRVTFGPGTHLVGVDIPPGTYRTRTNGPGCMWQRLRSTNGDGGDVITWEQFKGSVVVTIEPTDYAFFVDWYCPEFTNDLSAITESPTAPFPSGTYQVGIDIAPGVWKASGDYGCIYRRMRGYTGVLGDVIEQVIAQEWNPTVTILPTDTAFATQFCGKWTKIG